MGPRWPRARFADDPEALAAQRAADQSVDHDNPLEEVFEDQLLCADLVVLNKADLIDAATRARVRAEVEGHLPRAVKVVETENGAIDPRVLLGLGAAAEDDLAARPSHHGDGEDHDHDDFETVALPIRPAVDRRGSRGPRREGGRDRAACCASRASRRSKARRCAWWCRASAAASPTISTGPGGRASRGTGRSW